MRLRRSSVETPGITRRRRGRGFSYEDAAGDPVRDEETLQRIRALVIPPAWEEVWICANPVGHIQAAGTDAAGRRQYLYHADWRVRRDAEKFDRMLAFARVLPRLRERIARDLSLRGMPKDKTLACAVRLLDQGFFRVGSESYARQNGSFGLATLRKEHVTVKKEQIVFDFKAKSGVRRVQMVHDPTVAPLVRTMKLRRSGGRELLAYREGPRWRDVRSSDINEYVRDAAGGEFTTKDFRTWHGTVLAAVFLATGEQLPAGRGGRSSGRRPRGPRTCAPRTGARRHHGRHQRPQRGADRDPSGVRRVRVRCPIRCRTTDGLDGLLEIDRLTATRRRRTLLRLSRDGLRSFG